MFRRGRKAYRGSGNTDALYRHCGNVQSVRPIEGVKLYLYYTRTEALYRPQGEYKYMCTVQVMQLCISRTT